jgi:hypothetical protein
MLSIKKSDEKICKYEKKPYLCIRNSGCSSARLEYASGGRVVASSNLVTPTNRKALIIYWLSMLFSFYHLVSFCISLITNKEGSALNISSLAAMPTQVS